MSTFEKYSIAFPARDAFYHGLSREFYDEFSEFRNIFDLASTYFSENLYEIAYVNPDKNSNLHTVCLIVHCIALYQLLLSHCKKEPYAAFGFSQGEFAAISAANSLPFPNVLKLVYELELLLNGNTEIKQGIMVRIMGLDRKDLEECCHWIDPEGKNIALSIFYSQDQNVVSGRKDKIDEVSKLAKQKGARWVIPLNGGGAFHSPLCRNIIINSRQIFNKFYFTNSQFAVFSCVDGKMSMDGNIIKEKLSKQIAMPIVWDRLIMNQKEYGSRCILELGPGCTISGNTRIIDDTIKCIWINDLNDFKNAIEQIN